MRVPITSSPRLRHGLLIVGWLCLSASPIHAAEDDDTYASDPSQEDIGEVDDEEDSDSEVKKNGATVSTAEQAREGERIRVASSTAVRRFHEVLDELLAEFSYDVKMGQIKGLSNLAIRRVKVSQAIPRTYEDYLETLLGERIRENSQVKMIACVPCKTRTSSLIDGKLMITSPATNLAKLEAAAAQLGIEYFLDGVLVYHTTHMVLAVSVFNAQTKELVWARTYNSETIKSRYQKLAVDYSQVAKARPGEDYVPEYRVLVGFGGAALPNVNGGSEDSTMLNVQIRAAEKFNNRRTEFGMLLSIFKTTSSLVKDYPTDGASADEPASTDSGNTSTTTAAAAQPKPYDTAIGLFGLYSHLFVGSVESYNEARHGFHVGAGALAASGYVAPAIRGGWDIYFGRRFATSLGASYIAPSSVQVNGETIKTKGGAGGDLILSFNL